MNRRNLQIELEGRNETVSLGLRNFDVVERGTLKSGWYAKLYTTALGLNVFLFATKHDGFKEFDFRIVLGNGIPNTGPVYLRGIRVILNGETILSESGKHVIPTRLAWSRRFSTDPRISRYEHLANFAKDRPQWVKDKLSQAPSYRTQFGMYESWGDPSPYAHGGARIAPYHGMWWQCVEGFERASKYLDGTTDRCRLLVLDESGRITQIPREYTLVKAPELEMKEYQEMGDGWCSYEKRWWDPHWSGGVGTHDGSHMRRSFSEALVLRDYDPWAAMWADIVYNDARMAYTMDRDVEPMGYAGPESNFHQTLWWRLDNVERGKGVQWGGRELAHVMGLAAYLERDRELWQDVTRKIAMRSGVTHYVPPGSYHLQEARVNPPGMTGSITQCFEVMLLLHAQRLNGADYVADRAAQFIGSHPMWYVDVNTGEQANKEGSGGVGWYSAFTHNDLSEWGNDPVFHAKLSGMDESPFDCIHPEITDFLLTE